MVGCQLPIRVALIIAMAIFCAATGVITFIFWINSEAQARETAQEVGKSQLSVAEVDVRLQREALQNRLATLDTQIRLHASMIKSEYSNNVQNFIEDRQLHSLAATLYEERRLNGIGFAIYHSNGTFEYISMYYDLVNVSGALGQTPRPLRGTDNVREYILSRSNTTHEVYNRVELAEDRSVLHIQGVPYQASPIQQLADRYRNMPDGDHKVRLWTSSDDSRYQFGTTSRRGEIADLNVTITFHCWWTAYDFEIVSSKGDLLVFEYPSGDLLQLTAWHEEWQWRNSLLAIDATTHGTHHPNPVIAEFARHIHKGENDTYTPALPNSTGIDRIRVDEEHNSGRHKDYFVEWRSFPSLKITVLWYEWEHNYSHGVRNRARNIALVICFCLLFVCLAVMIATYRGVVQPLRHLHLCMEALSGLQMKEVQSLQKDQREWYMVAEIQSLFCSYEWMQQTVRDCIPFLPQLKEDIFGEVMSEGDLEDIDSYYEESMMISVNPLGASQNSGFRPGGSDGNAAGRVVSATSLNSAVTTSSSTVAASSPNGNSVGRTGSPSPPQQKRSDGSISLGGSGVSRSPKQDNLNVSNQSAKGGGSNTHSVLPGAKSGASPANGTLQHHRRSSLQAGSSIGGNSVPALPTPSTLRHEASMLSSSQRLRSIDSRAFITTRGGTATEISKQDCVVAHFSLHGDLRYLYVEESKWRELITAVQHAVAKSAQETKGQVVKVGSKDLTVCWAPPMVQLSCKAVECAHLVHHRLREKLTVMFPDRPRETLLNVGIADGNALVGITGTIKKSYICEGECVTASQLYANIAKSLHCPVLTSERVAKETRMVSVSRPVDRIKLPKYPCVVMERPEVIRNLYQSLSMRKTDQDEWMYMLEEQDRADEKLQLEDEAFAALIKGNLSAYRLIMAKAMLERGSGVTDSFLSTRNQYFSFSSIDLTAISKVQAMLDREKARRDAGASNSGRSGGARVVRASDKATNNNSNNNADNSSESSEGDTNPLHPPTNNKEQTAVQAFSATDAADDDGHGSASKDTLPPSEVPADSSLEVEDLDSSLKLISLPTKDLCPELVEYFEQVRSGEVDYGRNVQYLKAISLPFEEAVAQKDGSGYVCAAATQGNS